MSFTSKFDFRWFALNIYSVLAITYMNTNNKNIQFLMFCMFSYKWENESRPPFTSAEDQIPVFVSFRGSRPRLTLNEHKGVWEPQTDNYLKPELLVNDKGSSVPHGQRQIEHIRLTKLVNKYIPHWTKVLSTFARKLLSTISNVLKFHISWDLSNKKPSGEKNTAS